MPRLVLLPHTTPRARRALRQPFGAGSFEILDPTMSGLAAKRNYSAEVVAWAWLAVPREASINPLLVTLATPESTAGLQDRDCSDKASTFAPAL
jgi:hypothetical protein